MDHYTSQGKVGLGGGRKVPTHPFPNPTPSLTFHLKQNFGLREGLVGNLQNPILIPQFLLEVMEMQDDCQQFRQNICLLCAELSIYFVRVVESCVIWR